MNIALSPLIILLLAFPGVLFRYYYRKGIEASPVNLRNVAEEVAWGALFAAVIHAFFLVLLTKINFLPGAGELVVRLIIGDYGKETAQTDPFVSELTADIPTMVGYIAIVSALGAVLGFLLHHVVDSWYLDIRFPKVCQFPNPWSYLFKGRGHLMQYVKEELQVNWPTCEQLNRAKNRDSFTVVYAVVEQDKKPYVYGGVFEDCEFAPDGELDRIILTGPFRFPLPDKKSPSLKETPGYFDIDAERFVIQYSDVKTLALGYFTKEEIKGAASSEPTLEPA